VQRDRQAGQSAADNCNVKFHGVFAMMCTEASL
jgi:hypothetical protein